MKDILVCGNCATENTKDSRFCKECGAEIAGFVEEVNNENIERSSEQEGGFNRGEEYQNQSIYNDEEKAVSLEEEHVIAESEISEKEAKKGAKKANKKRKRGPIFIFILLILMCIAAAFLFTYNKMKDESFSKVIIEKDRISAIENMPLSQKKIVIQRPKGSSVKILLINVNTKNKPKKIDGENIIFDKEGDYVLEIIVKDRIFEHSYKRKVKVYPEVISRIENITENVYLSQRVKSHDFYSNLKNKDENLIEAIDVNQSKVTYGKKGKYPITYTVSLRKEDKGIKTINVKVDCTVVSEDEKLNHEKLGYNIIDKTSYRFLSLYKEILEDNKEDILNYNWQRDDRYYGRKAKPIGFCDIDKDGIVEMLFMKSPKDHRNIAVLDIYSYKSGKAAPLEYKKDEYERITTEFVDINASAGVLYGVFSKKDESGFVIYESYGDEYRYNKISDYDILNTGEINCVNTVQKMWATGDGKKRPERFESDGEKITKKEYQKYVKEISQDVDKVIIHSGTNKDIIWKNYGKEDAKDLSFDEAINFLNTYVE